VEQITCNGIFAPGFIFFAEHARQYHHDSDKLKNPKEYGANPPAHSNASSFLFIFFDLKLLQSC
jgi:hypothetical protein